MLELLGAKDQACFLFASSQSAQECIDFSTSPRRNDGLERSPVDVNRISIRAFKAKYVFYAVIFPVEKRPVVGGFWVFPGSGLSSRFAEAILKHLDGLQEINISDNESAGEVVFQGSTHDALSERILHYLERAPLNPSLQPRPSSSDVYFFPTGMAAVYKPHSYLLKRHPGTTILFGMAFMHTSVLFEEIGAGYKFFGLGTDEDLVELAAFLRNETDHGRKINAIWAEFPANPLLVTPNITRLRELANEYDTILALDDTLGGFANIDITAMSDILVTSLTKSFNGYADVIAGCTILNPASRKYHELKSLFDQHYVPELYTGDAATILHNSADYLSRTTKLNTNAHSLVTFLHSRAIEPTSAVRAVYYPSLNPSGSNYKNFMRPSTPSFTPGYGCLFSVEFDDLETTIAFYDNLNVHIGPHLGAPFTLAFAYNMIAYGKKLDWAARYGLRPTQIRVSAGLEETEVLVEEFRRAVEKADEVKRRRKRGEGG